MNSLVAYGSDDDVSPRSHPSPNPLLPPPAANTEDSRGGESEEQRRRKDSDYFGDEPFGDDDERNSNSSRGSETGDGYFEPPPPRRVETAAEHSPSLSPLVSRGMVKNESTASLRRYEKDAFEREDDRLAARNREVDDDDDEDSRQPGSSEDEPAPPARQPTADEDEDYEEAIDRQLQECKDLLQATRDGSETGTSTPRYEDPSPPRTEEGPATPSHLREPEEIVLDEEVRIPPPPDTPVNADVAAKFQAMFEKKAQGMNINAYIKNQKNFRNPSIYESFIDKFGLKELGTNFPPSLFDPEGFPEDCFYDKIGEQQRIAMEKAEKKREAPGKPRDGPVASDAPLAKKAKH